MNYTYQDISKMIDHSLLNPTLTQQDLEHGCELARVYDVASVCILPYYLARCTQILEGTTVQPSTTIGFPHGGNRTETKQNEAATAIEDGCQELDMVVNISKVLSGDWQFVEKDINAVISVAHQANRRVKVIFENCYLQNDHKIRLCQICSDLKADWVKTSTGYGTGGATHKDLILMRDNTSESVQVKAAGGVRDMDSLLEVRKLGVSRIGASRTQSMLDDCRNRLGLAPIEFSSRSSEVGY